MTGAQNGLHLHDCYFSISILLYLKFCFTSYQYIFQEILNHLVKQDKEYKPINKSIHYLLCSRSQTNALKKILTLISLQMYIPKCKIMYEGFVMAHYLKYKLRIISTLSTSCFLNTQSKGAN